MAQLNAIEVTKVAQGSNSDTTTTLALTLGFEPKYMRVSNVTAAHTYEFHQGMADSAALKTDSNGIPAAITTGGFIVGDRTISNLTKSASDTVYWIALG